MILGALHAEATLRADSRGLSMGGGRERLLYAVARHVDRLVVTDLYGGGSDWEEARTDDPRDFMRRTCRSPWTRRGSRPGAWTCGSSTSRQTASIFATSSCAIKHIGGRDDFLGHLREAHRVLKEGGIYVLTTEFHYGPETIELPGNYLFSGGYLSELLR